MNRRREAGAASGDSKSLSVACNKRDAEVRHLQENQCCSQLRHRCLRRTDPARCPCRDLSGRSSNATSCTRPRRRSYLDSSAIVRSHPASTMLLWL